MARIAELAFVRQKAAGVERIRRGQRRLDRGRASAVRAARPPRRRVATGRSGGRSVCGAGRIAGQINSPRATKAVIDARFLAQLLVPMGVHGVAQRRQPLGGAAGQRSGGGRIPAPAQEASAPGCPASIEPHPGPLLDQLVGQRQSDHAGADDQAVGHREPPPAVSSRRNSRSSIRPRNRSFPSMTTTGTHWSYWLRKRRVGIDVDQRGPQAVLLEQLPGIVAQMAALACVENHVHHYRPRQANTCLTRRVGRLAGWPSEATCRHRHMGF